MSAMNRSTTSHLRGFAILICAHCRRASRDEIRIAATHVYRTPNSTAFNRALSTEGEAIGALSKPSDLR
ncbi:hypothetical protein M413DRAFT_404121 [Hebeloma cylindrosporum]|uniref:Uncharacterized protein n=1 Tax=Hebeloma cylindrosporum TaxID=76867 RepID=A0A0C3CIG9_HEBCY|nr:hypothetical protein M413DRAFT_404121 [Hebeloma cylindrosporum h7]